MIKHYVTLAFRNLLRNKFQSLFSILGLAVAFFCFGLFAYFVHALTTPDEWAPNHGRMVYLTSSDYLRNTLDMNEEELEQIKRLPEVESICRFKNEQYAYFQFDNGEYYQSMRIPCIKTDTTFHNMFNPRLIAGSWNDALSAENSIAMCESYAKRCFGSAEDAIGKSLFNGQFSYIVRAVVEDLAQNNTIAFMTNIGGYKFNDIKQGDVLYKYYVMANEGYSSKQLKTAINQLGLSHSTDYFHGEVVKAAKPAVLTLFCEDAMGGKVGLWFGYSFVSLIILLPGLLILLSALSNFFHLLLSNIMMRRREYVLRRAHGAHTLHLWLMVSTQVVISMLLVGLASLLIVDIVAPLLQFNVNSILITFDTHLMLVQDLEHITILLIIGLLVAWLAVARVRRDSLQEAMKTSTGSRPSRHILRNILLCWQLSVGCFFITILAAVYLQLGQNQRSTLPQFSEADKENILLFNCYSYEDDIDAGSIVGAVLSASPDVERFAPSGSSSPFMSGWKDYIIGEHGDTIMISFMTMNQQQFEFLNIPLLSGDWTHKGDEVLADPDFLGRYHKELGDQITVIEHFFEYNDDGSREEVFQDRNFTITGVVDSRMSDFNHNVTGGLKPDPGIFAFHQSNMFYWVKCRPGTIDKVKHSVSDALDDAGIRMDLNFDTLKHRIDQEFEGISQFIPIFWLFCFIALAIAMLGIYSAITVDTTYRRKEMAIRKINGAKARHIVMLFAQQYFRLLVIASAIAFPLAFFLIHGIVVNTFLTTFNHGIGFYLGIFLLIAVFVAMTVCVQIWRISKIEPATVVKSE